MINLSLEGAKDAIDTFREIIVPWQKEQAERKLRLENALRQAEIQRLNAQTLAEQAKIEQERSLAEINKSQAKKIEAEAKLALAQAEKVLAEAEKERELMKLERIRLAERIVEKYNPSASGAEKINFIIRLLPEIDRLITSGINLIE